MDVNCDKSITHFRFGPDRPGWRDQFDRHGQWLWPERHLRCTPVQWEFIGKYIAHRRKDENTDDTPHVWTRANLFRRVEESRTAFLLRFTLSHLPANTIIVGTPYPEHLKENVYEEAKRRLDRVGVAPVQAGWFGFIATSSIPSANKPGSWNRGSSF